MNCGTHEDFHRHCIEEALPLLKRWNFDVVAYGPSLCDENTYHVIRRFDSLAQRGLIEDTFYASDDLRQGPRERILALIANRSARILSLNSMRSLYRDRDGYRLRVGDWRVIYEIQNVELVILVLKVAPRGEVYR